MSYEKTSLPGGIPKLIQVCEHLRANNQDGYIQHQGSLIARFKGDAHRFGKLITCSPFTGSAIGVAFDPKFPRGVGEAYEPMFNGGKDLLPFAKFYAMHNDHDQPAQSLPAFGLGELIDMKKMRRGDQVGIDWFPTGGHSVFVWDVHLDAHGDVDCFQMIGAHGPAGGAHARDVRLHQPRLALRRPLLLTRRSFAFAWVPTGSARRHRLAVERRGVVHRHLDHVRRRRAESRPLGHLVGGGQAGAGVGGGR